MSRWRDEIRVFFTAVMFFTRLPCPASIDHRPEWLQRAPRYFAVVGCLVGAASAAVHAAAVTVLPVSIAVLGSIAASLLITGAFHEDGFADFCDGFGGGFDRDRILAIMKDSRVGAFGAIGICMLLLSRHGLLVALALAMPLGSYCLLLIGLHAASRALAASVLFTHQYAREDLDSKSKPMATQMSGPDLAVNAIVGLLPFVLLMHPTLWLCVVPGWLMRQWLVGKCVRWLGGYTGDCLGAIQQAADLTLAVAGLALWRST
jgi:adenosylcobinamide-GDP ribazoletransferase